jgi:hypothetical protein
MPMTDLDKGRGTTTPPALAVELAVAPPEVTEDVESAPVLDALRVTTPVPVAVAVAVAVALALALVLHQT